MVCTGIIVASVPRLALGARVDRCGPISSLYIRSLLLASVASKLAHCSWIISSLEGWDYNKVWRLRVTIRLARVTLAIMARGFALLWRGWCRLLSLRLEVD